MSNSKFFLGGFLLRKKQAFQGFAIAPAASLASLSPVAAFGALTILATGKVEITTFSVNQNLKMQKMFYYTP